MSAMQLLCVLEDANCCTDHFPVQLRIHVARDNIVASKAGLPLLLQGPESGIMLRRLMTTRSNADS